MTRKPIPSPRLADWLTQSAEAAGFPAALCTRLREALPQLPAPTEESLVVGTLRELARLRADGEMLAAALLHDWPPALALIDAAPRSALARTHPRVALLLDGQSAARQVWSLHAERGGAGNAEGLRRLLLAIIRDLRVVPILLARQLVRLRAAATLPPAEQRALAELTADIHAPLANRLGIWQLKWELEDLAFRVLHPDIYKRVATLLDEKRGDRERFIEEVKQQLRAALDEAGIHGEVAGRPKHIFSIWKKMQRKGVPFGELYDVRAVRVLVDDIGACYSVLGLVHQLWPPVPAEFDDYIANPKGNQYRSLHTAVVGPGGRTLEVQIRTVEMHEHAELGVAAHWRYKEGGGGDAEFERKVAWMRQLLERTEAEPETEAGERDDALLAGLSTELIEDRVYALTPRGEVVDLPRGGTVLDFAYHVHTEVGNRCTGAKVNGRIVPLNYQLKSGARVEILTSKTAQPRRDWLLAANGFLASARARHKVRAHFHRLDRDRNLQAGRELLDRELKRLALGHADLTPALERFHLPSVEELQLAVALGDIGPSQVARAVHEHTLAQAQVQTVDAAAAAVAQAQTVRVRPARPSASFTVEGVGNLLTQLARCCQPVAGDAIAGYLTRARGVSIHRVGCPSLQHLAARHPERLLPVEWGRQGGASYSVDTVIHAVDRKGLLKDLTNAIAQGNAHVLAVNSRVDAAHGLAEVRFTLKVADFDQLGQLLTKLNTVPGVQSARRLS